MNSAWRCLRPVAFLPTLFSNSALSTVFRSSQASQAYICLVGGAFLRYFLPLSRLRRRWRRRRFYWACAICGVERGKRPRGGGGRGSERALGKAGGDHDDSLPHCAMAASRRLAGRAAAGKRRCPFLLACSPHAPLQTNVLLPFYHQSGGWRRAALPSSKNPLRSA